MIIGLRSFWKQAFHLIKPRCFLIRRLWEKAVSMKKKIYETSILLNLLFNYSYNFLIFYRKIRRLWEEQLKTMIRKSLHIWCHLLNRSVCIKRSIGDMHTFQYITHIYIQINVILIYSRLIESRRYNILKMY